MNILVAGGAGFVGSHLCGRLLQLGHTVFCMDNLVTGRKANIRSLRESPNFHFIERSVLDPVWLPVKAIYNLASPASPPHYQAQPEATLRTNVEGSLNLLRLAEETGSRYIYASTSEVYGDPTQHPQAESYLGNVRTMGPRACYDEGKRCGETLCYVYSSRGLDVSVVRIFNTYGPRMRADDGRAVSNFMTQALEDAPITIYGDGSHTRSFCYVDDLVGAFVRLLDLPEAPAGPLNVGNPAEITVLELAETILRLTGSRSRIEFRPLPADDPTRRCPDISRAREILNWRPTTPLEEGLKKTMQSFRRQAAPLTTMRVAAGQ